jgi:hypothetical protein
VDRCGQRYLVFWIANMESFLHRVDDNIFIVFVYRECGGANFMDIE